MNAKALVPHIIDGKEVASQDGQEFDDIDPWTRQPSGRVALGGTAEVSTAVDAARAAFDDGAWSDLTFQERGSILHRLADLMEAHADELALADVTDMGRPLRGMQALDVPRAVGNFRFFADHARMALTEGYPLGPAYHGFTEFGPAGVVAAITPWNHPLMLGTWKIAAPLAWGNTVVHKPAEDTPTSAYLVGRLALEAGIPPGVLNVVQGTGSSAGAPLTASPGIDRITFTGATATGRAISCAAGANLTPVSLELGGKGANLVFADCDLESTVEWTAKAIFNNSGQVCLSASRIYVERPIYEEFAARLVAAGKALRVGDPKEAGTDLGPLASGRHFDKVSSYFDLIEQEGGRVLTGGPGDGWAFSPVVAEGLGPSGRLCQEEVFGPLAMLSPFDEEADVVRLANGSAYGLSALVFTRDLVRAHRVTRSLRAGTVWVNCYQVRDLRAPLGGPGDSGIGREGGLFSRDFFTEPKVVIMAVR